MPSPIRFHLDESVTTVLALALRRRGIDVTTTAETGLISADDQRQLDFARAAGRVLVTRDHHFLALAKQGAEHVGIVYWLPRRHRLSETINLLTLL